MVVINSEFRLKSNTLSNEIQNRVKKNIEKIIDKLPSDSYTEVTVDIIPSGFWAVDFSVKYSRGHIAVKRFGVNLDLSIERVINEIQDRIKMWHVQREIETFRLDRSVEHDYYTEIIELIKFKPNGLKIMAVDDDPAALAVIKNVFSSLGCDVTTFDYPDDALDDLMSNAYDLIILDWNLPYKSGKDFLIEANSKLLELNKKGEVRARCPVVICSSLPVKDIDVPQVEQFQFLYPWHKEIPFTSIISSFEKAMKKLVHQKDISKANYGGSYDS